MVALGGDCLWRWVLASWCLVVFCPPPAPSLPARSTAPHPCPSPLPLRSGRCGPNASNPQPGCSDVPTPDGYTCQQQKGEQVAAGAEQ